MQLICSDYSLRLKWCEKFTGSTLLFHFNSSGICDEFEEPRLGFNLFLQLLDLLLLLSQQTAPFLSPPPILFLLNELPQTAFLHFFIGLCVFCQLYHCFKIVVHAGKAHWTFFIW